MNETKKKIENEVSNLVPHTCE